MIYNREKPRKRPTPEEAQKRMNEHLERLKKSVNESQTWEEPRPSQPQRMERARGDARVEREIVDIPRRYSESTDIAKEAVQLRGKMRAPEVRLMQAVHENLYAQYLNPAFMSHLKQIGKAEQVYPALEQVMHRPFDFQYMTLSDGTVNIVKRRPETEANVAIQSNFKITLTPDRGYIARVENGSTDVNLATRPGQVDWMSNPEYNTRMANYRERFQNEHYARTKWDKFWKIHFGVREPERTRQMLEVLQEGFDSISEEMKEIYLMEHTTFPDRLIAMIQARNFSFETGDPRFLKLKDRMSKQARAYRGLAFQRQVVVQAHPMVQGAYQLFMLPDQGAAFNWETDAINITKEGYFLHQDKDNNWQIDPRYNDRIRRAYYKANPEAKVTLSPEESSAIDGDVPGEPPLISEGREAREKRLAVIERLKNADMNTKKRVLKTIAAPEYHSDIDSTKDEAKMMQGFQHYFESNPANVQKAVEELDRTH